METQTERETIKSGDGYQVWKYPNFPGELLEVSSTDPTDVSRILANVSGETPKGFVADATLEDLRRLSLERVKQWVIAVSKGDALAEFIIAPDVIVSRKLRAINELVVDKANALCDDLNQGNACYLITRRGADRFLKVKIYKPTTAESVVPTEAYVVEEGAGPDGVDVYRVKRAQLDLKVTTLVMDVIMDSVIDVVALQRKILGIALNLDISPELSTQDVSDRLAWLVNGVDEGGFDMTRILHIIRWIDYYEEIGVDMMHMENYQMMHGWHARMEIIATNEWEMVLHLLMGRIFALSATMLENIRSALEPTNVRTDLVREQFSWCDVLENIVRRWAKRALSASGPLEDNGFLSVRDGKVEGAPELRRSDVIQQILSRPGENVGEEINNRNR